MTAEMYLCFALGGLFGAIIGHMATIKDLRRSGYKVPSAFSWDR